MGSKHAFVPVCVLLVMLCAASSCRAQDSIYTYDIGSLCYMSTAVVEATIADSHTVKPGALGDGWTATVIVPIEGPYRAGNRIKQLDPGMYYPCKDGQRCILFISTYDEDSLFDGSLKRTAPPALVDMLLIDRASRVRRYYQSVAAPGPLIASGYHVDGWPEGHLPVVVPASHPDEDGFPSVEHVCAEVRARWAALGPIQALLERPTTKAEIPLLLALLRDRATLRLPHDGPEGTCSDFIAGQVCSRLSEVADPATALDALAIYPHSIPVDENSQLSSMAVSTSKGAEYVLRVLADEAEAIDRRLAAADIVADVGIDAYDNAAAKVTIRHILDSTQTPLQLKLEIVSQLDDVYVDTAEVLSAQGKVLQAAGSSNDHENLYLLQNAYRHASSAELEYAIESQLMQGFSDAQYDTLHAPSGPIASIVRRAAAPSRLGCVALESELCATNAVNLNRVRCAVRFTNVTKFNNGRAYLTAKTAVDENFGLTTGHQVRLPPGMPAGRYRIALEFLYRGRVISIGHSCTLDLPGARCAN